MASVTGSVEDFVHHAAYHHPPDETSRHGEAGIGPIAIATVEATATHYDRWLLYNHLRLLLHDHLRLLLLVHRLLLLVHWLLWLLLIHRVAAAA